MLKKVLGACGKVIYKAADKTPFGVLAVAVPFGISMLYAKGVTSTINQINKQAKELGANINVTIK